MKITDRVKSIRDVDNVSWDGEHRKLTVYHHGERNTLKIKVAALLRQVDVIDSIDEIVLVS